MKKLRYIIADLLILWSGVDSFNGWTFPFTKAYVQLICGLAYKVSISCTWYIFPPDNYC